MGRFLLRFLRCLLTAFAVCTIVQISHPRFLLVLVGAALLGTIFWPRFEERFGVDRTLYASFLPIRYGLAFITSLYGFAKICGLQFYTPLVTLDTALGFLSGFELAWAFFGHSVSYAYFIGGLQILGALLLLSRRTTTVGALLLLPIYVNIVFINFGFGVPVYFFSTLYLILAIYLLTPDLARLCRVLLWNQATLPRPFVGLFSRPGQQRVADGIKAALVCLLFLVTFRSMRAFQRAVMIETPVMGAWRIVPDNTDSTLPWEKVYFERGFWGVFRDHDGLTRRGFVYHIDETGCCLSITLFGDEEPVIVAHFERTAPDEMILTGTYRDRPFTVRMAAFNVRPGNTYR